MQIVSLAENRIRHFIQICSFGGNLHELSNPVFWKNKKLNNQISRLLNSPRVVKINYSAIGSHAYVQKIPISTIAVNDILII